MRKLTVMNTLTHDEYTLDVAGEETMNEILDRYLVHNSHASSYTWKRLGKNLNMAQTMEDNGMIDEYDEMI